MDIPFPSRLTMSGNHWPAGEMQFKCFRCCIAKKEERNAGGGGGGVGVGDRLEGEMQFKCFRCCIAKKEERNAGGGGRGGGWRPAREPC